MSVYYLNANDFGQENNHLAASIGGLTLIMFHSQRCGHCIKFLPEFKTLPGTIDGVNFGVCNVDAGNRVIVEMSKSSTTPITSVPKFILYNDGIPAVEYSGQRSRQAIIGFLQEIISKLNHKQMFTRPQRSRQMQGGMQGGIQGGMQGGGQLPHPLPQPAGRPAEQSNGNSTYKITPSTGVKEYETSYGRPYNTLNEVDFLEYENAYKQQMKGK